MIINGVFAIGGVPNIVLHLNAFNIVWFLHHLYHLYTIYPPFIHHLFRRAWTNMNFGSVTSLFFLGMSPGFPFTTSRWQDALAGNVKLTQKLQKYAGWLRSQFGRETPSEKPHIFSAKERANLAFVQTCEEKTSKVVTHCSAMLVVRTTIVVILKITSVIILSRTAEIWNSILFSCPYFTLFYMFLPLYIPTC